MSNLDVVARFQLRAEEFSRNAKDAFAVFNRDAVASAQQARTAFDSNFAEIQGMVRKALTLPKDAGGGLNLNVAGLKQAAIAAEAEAGAFRSVAVAAERAASATGDTSQATRLYVAAAQAAATEAEDNAKALTTQANAVDRLQTELNQLHGPMKVVNAAGDQLVVSAGQQRASMISLGQQFGDFGVQVLSGQRVLAAFAQQAPQAGLAMSGLGGKLGAVGTFLTRPWGIALTIGGSALAMFAAKVLDTSDALETAITKLREEARQSEVTAQAKVRFAQTEEGVTAAIREQAIALKQIAEAENSAAERANMAAKNAVERLITIRQQTIALLEQAKAEKTLLEVRSRAPGERGELATLGLDNISGIVAGLDEKIAKQNAAILEAQRNLNGTRVELAVEQGKRAADPIARINKQYDDMIVKAKAAARGNAELTNSLFKQTEAIETRRRAALKKEQEKTQKGAQTALGTQLRNEQSASLLSDAKRYSGLREGSGGLAALFSGAGVRIDPEKEAWCAAFVQAVLAGQGIKGTGSMAARSYLGFGSAVTKPEPGDIVILKRPGGGAGAGHVGFYAGQGAGGSILVTGGNQGDAVSTAAFKRSDVLGFRRAPTGSEAYKAEQRALTQETNDLVAKTRELQSLLQGLEGSYDPAAAAARRYKKELASIVELETKSAANPTPIDPEAAARLRSGARAAYMKAVLPSPSGDGGISKYLENADKLRDDQKRQAEQDMRELSDYFYDLFSGRTDDIWRRFKQMALGGIADSVAKQAWDKIIKGDAWAPMNAKGNSGDDPATTELRKINGGLDRLGIKLPKDIGKTLIEGAGVGMIAGGVFGQITGGKQSQLGGALGGAVGEVVGKSLTKGLTGMLGNLGGPLGGVVGGVLGSVVGGLFKKTKSGSATLSIDNGSIGVAGTSGNSSSYRAAASGLAGGVGDSLTRIADALGGSLTGPIGVSIGKRKDSFVVDTTGSGRTKGAGTMKFDTEEAAIRAAISNALSDGAIQGISDASKRILAAGGKLESAIEKASMIEAIPKQLMAMLDPVGAALDELNSKWVKTVAALKEGGATAEQMAQAEQLYRLQLAETKATTAEASASLKDFLKSLSIGSNSPLSLRDQETAAMSALQPFLAQIDKGDRVDQDKYREAAQAYLDIERQLGGSTDRYFEQFGRIQDYTNRAIAAIDNAVPIREAKPDPFLQATATNTKTTNELLSQISEQLQSLGFANGGSGSAPSMFFNDARGYLRIA